MAKKAKKTAKRAAKKVDIDKKEYYIVLTPPSKTDRKRPYGSDVHSGSTPEEAIEEVSNCCGVDWDDILYKLTPIARLKINDVIQVPM